MSAIHEVWLMQTKVQQNLKYLESLRRRYPCQDIGGAVYL